VAKHASKKAGGGPTSIQKREKPVAVSSNLNGTQHAKKRILQTLGVFITLKRFPFNSKPQKKISKKKFSKGKSSEKWKMSRKLHKTRKMRKKHHKQRKVKKRKMGKKQHEKLLEEKFEAFC
jgi:hypothetical protein